MGGILKQVFQEVIGKRPFQWIWINGLAEERQVICSGVLWQFHTITEMVIELLVWTEFFIQTGMGYTPFTVPVAPLLHGNNNLFSRIYEDK